MIQQGFVKVETKGIEPSTPGLQSRSGTFADFVWFLAQGHETTFFSVHFESHGVSDTDHEYTEMNPDGHTQGVRRGCALRPRLSRPGYGG